LSQLQVRCLLADKQPYLAFTIKEHSGYKNRYLIIIGSYIKDNKKCHHVYAFRNFVKNGWQNPGVLRKTQIFCPGH
ncbi:MAG: hypothetical protein LUE10_03670, partial [Alistipes sp.]|nr:hypothetical protein [Alistipes sp.]